MSLSLQKCLPLSPFFSLWVKGRSQMMTTLVFMVNVRPNRIHIYGWQPWDQQLCQLLHQGYVPTKLCELACSFYRETDILSAFLALSASHKAASELQHYTFPAIGVVITFTAGCHRHRFSEMWILDVSTA